MALVCVESFIVPDTMWASPCNSAVYVSSGGHSNKRLGWVPSSYPAWLAIVGEADSIVVACIAVGRASTPNGSEESREAKKRRAIAFDTAGQPT